MGIISSKHVHKFLEGDDLEDGTPKPSKILQFDPRSPSENVFRTPIAVEENAGHSHPRNVCDYSFAKQLAKNSETPKANVDSEEESENKQLRPFNLALLLDNEDGESGQASNDPRSPTERVPRTPMDDVLCSNVKQVNYKQVRKMRRKSKEKNIVPNIKNLSMKDEQLATQTCENLIDAEKSNLKEIIVEDDINKENVDAKPQDDGLNEMEESGESTEEDSDNSEDEEDKDSTNDELDKDDGDNSGGGLADDDGNESDSKDYDTYPSSYEGDGFIDDTSGRGYRHSWAYDAENDSLNALLKASFAKDDKKTLYEYRRNVRNLTRMYRLVTTADSEIDSELEWKWLGGTKRDSTEESESQVDSTNGSAADSTDSSASNPIDNSNADSWDYLTDECTDDTSEDSDDHSIDAIESSSVSSVRWISDSSCEKMCGEKQQPQRKTDLKAANERKVRNKYVQRESDSDENDQKEKKRGHGSRKSHPDDYLFLLLREPDYEKNLAKERAELRRRKRNINARLRYLKKFRKAGITIFDTKNIGCGRRTCSCYPDSDEHEAECLKAVQKLFGGENVESFSDGDGESQSLPSCSYDENENQNKTDPEKKRGADNACEVSEVSEIRVVDQFDSYSNEKSSAGSLKFEGISVPSLDTHHDQSCTDIIHSWLNDYYESAGLQGTNELHAIFGAEQKETRANVSKSDASSEVSFNAYYEDYDGSFPSYHNADDGKTAYSGVADLKNQTHFTGHESTLCELEATTQSTSNVSASGGTSTEESDISEKPVHINSISPDVFETSVISRMGHFEADEDFPDINLISPDVFDATSEGEQPSNLPSNEAETPCCSYGNADHKDITAGLDNEIIIPEGDPSSYRCTLNAYPRHLFALKYLTSSREEQRRLEKEAELEYKLTGLRRDHNDYLRTKFWYPYVLPLTADDPNHKIFFQNESRESYFASFKC